MDHRQRELLASGAVVAIFLLVQLGALALVGPFQEEGLQEVENTSDPSLSIFYLAAILVATGLMLVALKYGGDAILRLVIILSGVYIALFVFQALLPELLTVSVGGTSLDVLAWAGALGLGGALLVYPEWYVIDAAGILMGIGAAALFGINFGILPALVLLSALAVYDAISVYGTEHMLTLASGVMDMRVPVLFVVPLSLSYSFLDDGKPESVQETADETDLDDAGGERDALYIGLGDAVMPTVLVASAAFFIETGPSLSVLGVTATLPAVAAMIGTMVGLVALLWLVQQGRAHAGLPLLNGGAITGYLLGALVSGISLVDALGLGNFL